MCETASASCGDVGLCSLVSLLLDARHDAAHRDGRVRVDGCIRTCQSVFEKSSHDGRPSRELKGPDMEILHLNFKFFSESVLTHAAVRCC